MQTLKTSKARENILSKIRKALSEDKLPMPFPEVDKENALDAFAKDELTVEEQFADNFTRLGGKFIFCSNEQELYDNLHLLYDDRGWSKVFCSEEKLNEAFANNKLNFIQATHIEDGSADACITGCEFVVARTGSVIISSKQHLGRTSTVFYPVHIIVVYGNQVVADIQDSLNALKSKYGNNLPSMINLNTGPSRTADIEKTLVVGVHGPGEVFCFFVNA
ncbi:MAG: lactate utilization protein B/C [Sphingobacteriales bacterium]|nr:MAG: lactate utilization protein B/C [Sphingobacteriales bacterium]